MFREYRVGYTQNFDAATQLGTDWQWTSCADIERAEVFWKQWEHSHFSKKAMSAMVILHIEWDLETGLSTCKIEKKAQHKLTPTIHYNKKEGAVTPVKAKLSAGYTTLTAATYPDPPPAEPTNMQMINAFLNHLNT